MTVLKSLHYNKEIFIVELAVMFVNKGSFIFLFLILLVGCTSKDSSSKANEFYYPSQEWETKQPEDVGLNETELMKLNERISFFNIHSMVMVKDGYIVHEYQQVNNDMNVYPVFSVTKSMISALVGLAIDKEYIDDVNQPIVPYFSYFNGEIDNIKKEQITIEHLLNMTSGLDYPEMQEGTNLPQQMAQSSDWANFVLERELLHDPGTFYNYSSGNSHLLSRIIAFATESNTRDFASDYLFEVIGMENVIWSGSWSEDNLGIANGGFGIKTSARDLARFGYLYLRDGVWKGEQIISSEWIKKSTEEHIYVDPFHGGYGFQWFVKAIGGYDAYYAIGFGGNYVIVIPELEMVVSFVSSLPGHEIFVPYQMISDYLMLEKQKEQ
ncbi:serine hydrolase domain-containing protein [Bacillus alkalicellulosilyticus]|uniref:serine hydrolase domain-containing protein n=1 Tax=Alkalihalobacterium alkalicellulosilyticum TaxID=1912214 RepID=UPI000996CB38|nr:serine hydrolase [Bacillus alkalicellulosilyticus]